MYIRATQLSFAIAKALREYVIEFSFKFDIIASEGYWVDQLIVFQKLILMAFQL